MTTLTGITLALCGDRPCASAQETVAAQADVGGRRALEAGPAFHRLATAETRRHSLDLRAGEYVAIAVEQHGIDVGVRLLSPDGRVLLDVGHRHAGTIEISAVASRPGTYRLEIRALETDLVHGRYVVQIVERRAAAPADSRRVAAARLVAKADALRSEWTRSSATTALRMYRDAGLAWRAADDRRGETRSARRLGATYHSLGKAEAGLPHLLESLRLARMVDDPALLCDSLTAAARAYADLGKTDVASGHAEEALRSSRAARAHAAEVEALNVLGDVYAFRGRKREAVELFDRALSLARELLDRRGQAQALTNLGYVYSDLADVDAAQSSFEQALRLWRSVGDRRGVASTVTGLGHLHVMLGENQVALGCYREARALFEHAEDQVGLATILAGLGMVNFRLGETTRAIESYRAAVERFKAVRLRSGEAANMLALGVCLGSAGRHTEALEGFIRALDLVAAISEPQLEARALELLGREYIEAGEFDKARERFERSLSLARIGAYRIAEINALDGLGQLARRRGDHAEALHRSYESLEISRQVKHRFAESVALDNIARTKAAQGRLDDALSAIRASLDVVESLRTDVVSLDLRATYLASVRDRHELEIDLLMQLHGRDPTQGYDARAFEASERARARSFLDGLAQARAAIREGVAPELLERERSVRRALNAAARRLAVAPDGAGRNDAGTRAREVETLTADYREVEARIRAESPRYAALVQPRPLTLAQIQDLVIDSESVLLQYFLGTHQSYVWAVTREGMSSHVLPGRGEVERQARALYESLTGLARSPLAASDGRLRGRLGEQAGTLGRMLLAPVSASLRRPRVLIVADGILHLLPFAALPDPSRTASSDRPRFLIADREIVHLPSASTVALLRADWRQVAHWPKSAMIFADPVFEADDPRIALRLASGRATRDHSAGAGATPEAGEPLQRAVRGIAGNGARGIPRLLAARREARNIAALAPGADTALDFAANRATATSARLADYRIVHFATHGIIDNDHPELSGIILSLFDRHGAAQDGFLRLHDIYNLKLPVDLVVLSACSTALGREVVGEGMIGLARGFMYAGARRVIASLWKVDDEATGELMTRFYRGMFENRLTPPAALRAAQLELSRSSRWSNAFYWAGFALQGDWK